MRILIFSGGTMADHALQAIRSGDFLIGVDRGALFLCEQGIRMQAAIGDFDSVNEKDKARIRRFSETMQSCDPVDKYETDTEMAFRFALEQQPREIVMYGATGSRMDHTLANVHLLRIGLERGVSTWIVDDHNRITLMNRRLTVKREGYTYLSLLPMTLEVTGITLKGFRYPLHRAALTIGNSLAISNRVERRSGDD